MQAMLQGLVAVCSIGKWKSKHNAYFSLKATMTFEKATMKFGKATMTFEKPQWLSEKATMIVWKSHNDVWKSHNEVWKSHNEVWKSHNNCLKSHNDCLKKPQWRLKSHNDVWKAEKTMENDPVFRYFQRLAVSASIFISQLWTNWLIFPWLISVWSQFVEKLFICSSSKIIFADTLWILKPTVMKMFFEGHVVHARSCRYFLINKCIIENWELRIAIF